MTPKLKRTLALVLAGGSLAIGVPAALAAGGGGDGSTGAPSSIIQDGRQQPDRDDCPEKDGAREDQGSSAGTTEAPAI